MKKEIFEVIKKEAMNIAAVFFIALAILKIAFYKETIAVLLRTSGSIFWLFALPGYFMMLYWHERLNFLERLIIGIIIAASATGVASYYLGIFGLNVRYHTSLLPLLFIASGLIAALLGKTSHISR